MLTFIRSLARRFSRNRPGTLSREGNERMRRAYPQFAHLADEEMFAEVSKHIFQTTMDSLRSIRKKIKTADDLRQSGQYESAETVSMGALEEIASHDDMLKNSLTSDHAELFRLLGLICKDRHEDSRARQLLEKGLGIAKGGGFHRIIGMLSNDLGIVCLRLGETTIAEEYCMQSLEYLTLAKAAKTDLAVSNACLGSVLLAKGDPERAVGQFMAALRYCDQADLKSQASIYGNLGKAYAFLRKWEMAIDAMRQSQSIMEQVGSVTGMLINHHLL